MELSSRELATLAWYLILVFATSKWIFPFITSALRSRVLNLVYLSILMYCVGMLLFLKHIGLWNFDQVKNTVVWFSTVGIILPFKIVFNRDKSSARQIVKEAILENFKFLQLLLIISSTYTFGLIGEFVLVGFASFVAILAVYAESQDSKPVQKFFKGILSVIGWGLLIYSLHALYTDFQKFGNMKTFYDFISPILLSVSYVPFLYLFGAYIGYENTFSRLQYPIENKSDLFYAKALAIIKFRYNFKLADVWLTTLQFSKIVNKKDIRSSIDTVLEIERLQNSPPAIPFNKGWSPYVANNYLGSFGIRLGLYFNYHENEYSSNSNRLEIGKSYNPNRIYMTLVGDKNIAKTIRLQLDVNEMETKEVALNQFAKLGEVLFQNATGHKAPNNFRRSIIKLKPYTYCIDHRKVEITFSEYKIPGYKNQLDATLTIKV